CSFTRHQTYCLPTQPLALSGLDASLNDHKYGNEDSGYQQCDDESSKDSSLDLAIFFLENKTLTQKCKNQDYVPSKGQLSSKDFKANLIYVIDNRFDHPE